MAERVSAAKFVAFLKERLAAKDGYIMGAVGQDPKSLSGWYFSGQYSGSRLKKALYWKEHAQRVWDCNGLAEGYYRDQTGVSINTRARNNYASWCDPRGTGMIPASRRVPGAAVFKKSDVIHHVGFLVEPVKAGNPGGDWYVIEAKGVMYGVVKTKLLSGGWNCWGLMTKYFDYDGVSSGAADVQLVLGDRMLKKGMEGEDVRRLQQILMELDYALPRWGADGEFGGETLSALKKLQAALGVEADGIYGGETHAALTAMLDQDDEKQEAAPAPAAGRLRVTASRSAFVRVGPGTEHSALTVVFRGMEFDFAARAENGWRCISVNGRLGWISPKMCEAI